MADKKRQDVSSERTNEDVKMKVSTSACFFLATHNLSYVTNGGGGGGVLGTRTSGNLSLKELNLKRYNEYPNGTGETNWVLGGTYVAPFCYSNNIFYTSTTALLESDLWNSRVFHVITEPQGAVHEFIKNSVT